MRTNTKLKQATKGAAVLLFLSLFLILGGCSAEPNEGDLEAVKKEFLARRFTSAYDKKSKHLSDLELFHQSCKVKRVKCSRVLGLLKKKDPEFFKKLSPIRKQENNSTQKKVEDKQPTKTK